MNEQTKAKAKAAKVEVINTAYEAGHGRAPKGTGLWIFAPTRDNDDREEAIWVNGSLSAAKKEASAIARSRGIHRLFVQP